MSGKTARYTQIDLQLLDALRGLAAGYVVVCHAAALLWSGVQASAIAEEGSAEAAAAHVLHGLVDYSPVAVLLFFLISGFCIHHRQARVLASGQAPPRTSDLLNLWAFARRRVRRLYPPLILALGLTAACDAIGTYIDAAFYYGPKPDAISWLGTSHTLATLLGNLAFQSSLAVASFGSDSPLWSLAYEFWFYVLYPVLLVVAARRGSLTMLAVAGASWILGYLGSRVSNVWISYLLMSWIVWTFGAVIAEAYAGRIRLPGLRWAAPVAVVGLALLSQRFPYSYGGRGEPKDLLWGAALAILLAYVLLEPAPMLVNPMCSITRRFAWLGNISYSLYLVHVPWLALVSAWWMRSHSQEPLGIELVLFGTLTAVAVGFAAWYLVERHCITSHSRSSLPA